MSASRSDLHPKIAKYITGIKALLSQLKTIASYNRTNDFYVIGEFTKNKFNPMGSDFHIRGIYNSETHEKLNYPQGMSKLCYNMTQEIQPEWKCYLFRASPLEFKFDEKAMGSITRELAEGRYGPYYIYRWNDYNTSSSLKEFGDIEL